MAVKHGVIDVAKREGRVALTEIEAKGLLKQAGISVVDAELAESKKAAVSLSKRLGFPVVLKIVSPDITHKSDVGGVRLELKTAEEVEKAYDGIMAAVGQGHPQALVQGVSVQKMARPGVEVIIGMTKDAQFGPVLIFGLGGILVEILKDVSFRVIPLNSRDARQMIREIKGYPLLKGYRGQEAVDVSYLEGLILKVSQLVEANPDIKELDINPVLAYSDGAVAVDARVILEERGR